MDTISSDTIKASMKLSFLDIEKTDKITSSEIPNDQFANHDKLKTKESEYLSKLSMKRKLRLDFNLKNVYFLKPDAHEENKFKYKMFSITWPIYSTEILNKKTKKGQIRILPYMVTKNDKVLVGRYGYQFLKNEMRTDYYGGDEGLIEEYEDNSFQVKYFTKKMSIESLIWIDNQIEPNSALSLEGYCLYNGSLITAERNWFWYPFDKYIVDMSIEFPFKEVDMEFSVDDIENFEIKILLDKKNKIENVRLANNTPLEINIILKRKNVYTYLGLAISIILLLLPAFIPSINNIAISRYLLYLIALTMVFFSTMPPENIIIFYPFRVGFLISISLLSFVNEYVYWLKHVYTGN